MNTFPNVFPVPGREFIRGLPGGLTSRPATMADVEAAVALANACSIEQIGKPKSSLDQFRTDWQSPYLHPETDLRVVFAPDARLVGYAGVWDTEPHVQMFGWGHVHPEYKGQGIGTYLAHWVEGRARQSIPRAPSGTRVVLRQEVLSTDQAAQQLLLAQGYQLVRHGLRMVIEMDGPPPEPAVPDGLVIRPFLRGREERDTILAVQEEFRDHWGYVERPFEQEYEEWMYEFENDPDFDPSLWFVALDGDQIAGTAFCFAKMAEDPEMGWLFGLGVRRPWRRRGLALALLHHCFGELYRRGRRGVSLGVDAQNLTGATCLYERAGMHVQRQHHQYEQELRPGRDLSIQSLEG